MNEVYVLPRVHCRECGFPVDFTWSEERTKTGYHCSCGHFEPAEDLSERELEEQIQRVVVEYRCYKPKV